MSEFAPGFASRHDAAAAALSRAFAPPEGFAPADIAEFLRGESMAKPRSFAPEPVRPRHFEPADRDADPTAGWDPFDPEPRSEREQGFVDPVAAAHAAGYAEGVSAGIAQATAEGARDQALMKGIADALAAGHHFDRERIAAQLRATVLHLVTRLVGDAGIDPALLAARIDTAIEMLADSAESALLRMNPEDVPLVEGKLPKSVFPVADPALARGAFVVESASTIVEDGPDLWLEQLAAAIERVPLPRAC